MVNDPPALGRLAAEVARVWSQGRAARPDLASAARDEATEQPAFLGSPLLANLVATHGGLVAQVLDMRRFRSVYVSPNVEAVTGFAPAEINAQGVLRFLTSLRLPELWLHVQNARRMVAIDRRMAPRTPFYSTLINSGMKTKHGVAHRIVCKNVALEWDAAGRQTYQLFLWKVATPLFKAQVPVWRHQWGPREAPVAVLTYHPDKGRFLDQELFSAREAEVLERLTAGRSSKAIASELGISPLTVDNHRKNLLARTGLKTTEGLVDVHRWLTWDAGA